MRAGISSENSSSSSSGIDEVPRFERELDPILWEKRGLGEKRGARPKPWAAMATTCARAGFARDTFPFWCRTRDGRARKPCGGHEPVEAQHERFPCALIATPNPRPRWVSIATTLGVLAGSSATTFLADRASLSKAEDATQGLEIE